MQAIHERITPPVRRTVQSRRTPASVGPRSAREAGVLVPAGRRGRRGLSDLRRARPPGAGFGRAAPGARPRRRTRAVALPARPRVHHRLPGLSLRGSRRRPGVPPSAEPPAGPAPRCGVRRPAGGRLDLGRAARRRVPLGGASPRAGPLAPPRHRHRRRGTGPGRVVARPGGGPRHVGVLAVHVGLDGCAQRGDGHSRQLAAQLRVDLPGLRLESREHGRLLAPLYHDMGLIGGVLQTLFCGGEQYASSSPVAFLQRPFRWLQAISTTKRDHQRGAEFRLRVVLRAESHPGATRRAQT